MADRKNIKRIKTFSAAFIAASLVAGGTAMAGPLPGIKQIGCWNKVVISCEAALDINARSMCQHTGFAACNRSFEEDSRVSIERIQNALPSFTATRIVVSQSMVTDAAAAQWKIRK